MQKFIFFIAWSLLIALTFNNVVNAQPECEADLPDECEFNENCSSSYACITCLNKVCAPLPACAKPCKTNMDCIDSADRGCGVCNICDGDSCVNDTNIVGTCVPSLDITPIYETLIRYASMLLLLCLSAMFSGLNLGLMGLDLFSLEIVMTSGSPKQKSYARRIYPLRKRGNLLLCTILLGNVAVNSLLSILMADITTGIIGFLLSTFLIVVFGEISPQSICSRHALAVGARSVPVVWFFLILLLPISWPVSKLLDLILGAELGTIYNRQELKKLLGMHSTAKHGDLTQQETSIMAGALDLSQKIVEQIMTSIDVVFSLDIQGKLDYNTLNMIIQKGYSRIPIYEGDSSNVVGLLLVKDLALLNHKDETPLKTVLQFYGRKLLRVYADQRLDQMLNMFKQERTHFALVRKVISDEKSDPYFKIVGIVTLEDVIEEILQDEIIDETDVFIDNRSGIPVQQGKDANYSSMIRRPRRAVLDPKQVEAVYAFLSSNIVKLFGPKCMSKKVLLKLLQQAQVLEMDTNKASLYERGRRAQFFTLVMEGKLEVRSGSEEFISHSGSFTYLGLGALQHKRFISDFSAKVIKKATLLRISKRLYDSARKATELSKLQRMSIDLSGLSVSNKGLPKLKKSKSVEAFSDNDGDDNDDNDDDDEEQQPRQKHNLKKRVEEIGDDKLEPLDSEIDHVYDFASPKQTDAEYSESEFDNEKTERDYLLGKKEKK